MAQNAMATFACMQWQYGPPGHTYPLPSQPSLFQPPMKTWLELFLSEEGCEASEVELCHEIRDGVECWWWQKQKSLDAAEGGG